MQVAILDETLKLIRRSFDGNDFIKNVALHKTVGEALDYVSHNYFLPHLGDLEPYEYTGKHGVGRPKVISVNTTIKELQKRQKPRKVGLDRINIYGMAALGMYDVYYDVI